MKRTTNRIRADALAATVARTLGQAVRAARRRRSLTQAALAARIGTSQSEISRLELGGGRRAPFETWIVLAVELGLNPRFELGRDWREEPVDAGHLAIQELLLRLGRTTGYPGTVELPIRPDDPAHSIDVCLRSDAARRLILEEAWNGIGDVGRAIRSFDRKLAAGRDLAAAIGGDRPYDVHGVWIVRATRRNRKLVARYPAIFESRFRGSSWQWVDALTTGAPPPADPGLVWCDVRAARLYAWRRKGATYNGSD